MLVEFSIVPLGAGSSISDEVAEILKIVAASGLPYKVNPMGTVVEGSWNQVLGLIKKCHVVMRRHEERVLTRILIDDRKGRSDMISSKLRSVEKKIGKPLKK
ncbi:MAG: MTH1187 family thiamine-binding protein [Thermodesulfovibrionales bacterium]